MHLFKVSYVVAMAATLVVLAALHLNVAADWVVDEISIKSLLAKRLATYDHGAAIHHGEQEFELDMSSRLTERAIREELFAQLDSMMWTTQSLQNELSNLKAFADAHVTEKLELYTIEQLMNGDVKSRDVYTPTIEPMDTFIQLGVSSQIRTQDLLDSLNQNQVIRCYATDTNGFSMKLESRSAACDATNDTCLFEAADRANCAVKQLVTPALTVLNEMDSVFGIVSSAASNFKTLTSIGKIISVLLTLATSIPYVGPAFVPVDVAVKGIVKSLDYGLSKTTGLINNALKVIQTMLNKIRPALTSLSNIPKLVPLLVGNAIDEMLETLQTFLQQSCMQDLLNVAGVGQLITTLASLRTLLTGYTSSIALIQSYVTTASNAVTAVKNSVSKVVSVIAAIVDALQPAFNAFAPIKDALNFRFRWDILGVEIINISMQDCIDVFDWIVNKIRSIPGVNYVLTKIEQWISSTFRGMTDYITKQLKLPDLSSIAVPDIPGLPLDFPDVKLPAELVNFLNWRTNLETLVLGIPTNFFNISELIRGKINLPSEFTDAAAKLQGLVNCADDKWDTCLFASLQQYIPNIQFNSTKLYKLAQAFDQSKENLFTALALTANEPECTTKTVTIPNPIAVILEKIPGNNVKCANPSVSLDFCDTISIGQTSIDAVKQAFSPVINAISDMFPAKSASPNLLQQRLRNAQNDVPYVAEWSMSLRISIPTFSFFKPIVREKAGSSTVDLTPALLKVESTSYFQIDFGVTGLETTERDAFCDFTAGAAEGKVTIVPPGMNPRTIGTLVLEELRSTLEVLEIIKNKIVVAASTPLNAINTRYCISYGLNDIRIADLKTKMDAYETKVASVTGVSANKIISNSLNRFLRETKESRKLVNICFNALQMGFKKIVYKNNGYLQIKEMLKGPGVPKSDPKFKKWLFSLLRLVDISFMNFALKYPATVEAEGNGWLPTYVYPTGFKGYGGSLRMAVSPFPLQLRYDGRKILQIPYNMMSTAGILSNFDFEPTFKVRTNGWPSVLTGGDADYYKTFGALEFMTEYIWFKRIGGKDD